MEAPPFISPGGFPRIIFLTKIINQPTRLPHKSHAQAGLIFFRPVRQPDLTAQSDFFSEKT